MLSYPSALLALLLFLPVNMTSGSTFEEQRQGVFIYGIAKGLLLGAQDETLALIAAPEVTGRTHKENCQKSQNNFLTCNQVARAVLSPVAVELKPEPNATWPETTVHLDVTYPAKAYSTLFSNIPVLEQTPAITWFNSKTLLWLESLILQVKEWFGIRSLDACDDVIPPPFVASEGERPILTTIYQDNNGELWSTTTLPTPTPRVKTSLAPSEIRLEYENDFIFIKPSPSGHYASETTSRLAHKSKQAPTDTEQAQASGHSAQSKGTTVLSSQSDGGQAQSETPSPTTVPEVICSDRVQEGDDSGSESEYSHFEFPEDGEDDLDAVESRYTWFDWMRVSGGTPATQKRIVQRKSAPQEAHPTSQSSSPKSGAPPQGSRHSSGLIRCSLSNRERKQEKARQRERLAQGKEFASFLEKHKGITRKDMRKEAWVRYQQMWLDEKPKPDKESTK